MRSKALFTLVVLMLMTLGAQAQKQTTSTTSGPYGATEFQLGPDDIIEVYIYQEKDFPVTVQVRPDGKVSLPLIGEIPAKGKTPNELQTEITGKYKNFFAEPAVTVVVKEVNSPKVSVFGEVKKPDSYKIKDHATLMDAIALAGGRTEYAKRDIVIMRIDSSTGKQQRWQINWDDQIRGRSDPFYILPYDKIYVQ